MINEAMVKQAVELLQKAAPGSTIIVFGSWARGAVSEDSDLDVLVIMPNVTDQWAEMVRLRRALRPLRIAADVIAVSREAFDKWADTPNTLLYQAANEGRIFHANPR